MHDIALCCFWFSEGLCQKPTRTEEGASPCASVDAAISFIKGSPKGSLTTTESGRLGQNIDLKPTCGLRKH